MTLVKNKIRNRAYVGQMKRAAPMSFRQKC
jgi:hypothetical protein